MKRDPVFGFRPLSGNLLSLLTVLAMDTNTCEPFSSPIGESTFSTRAKELESKRDIVFAPYRGIYFLYEIKEGCTMYDVDRFRPLSGNLLSLHYKLVDMYDYKKFSSPIGESTFSTRYLMGKSLKLKNSFRPLSGNLLSLPSAS